MEAGYVGGLGVLFLGGLSLFVVGFMIVITRGCGGLLVGDILHQCSRIGRSCMVVVAGEEVGKGGEFLVQVPTKLVEFTLNGSGGWLLVRGRVPRVPGRSKVWVATCAPDDVNCSKGKSSLLFVDSLGMVIFLQQAPGILQITGNILVGGRAKAKRLTG